MRIRMVTNLLIEVVPINGIRFSYLFDSYINVLHCIIFCKNRLQSFVIDRGRELFECKDKTYDCGKTVCDRTGIENTVDTEEERKNKQ